MKLFLALALLVSSFSAMSATVKVTSFNFIRTSNDVMAPLAELCGVVEGALTSAPSYVNAKIDPKSSKPASYNTITDTDGKFCMAVVTYRGTAEVSILGQKSVVTAKAE